MLHTVVSRLKQGGGVGAAAACKEDIGEEYNWGEHDFNSMSCCLHMRFAPTRPQHD